MLKYKETNPKYVINKIRLDPAKKGFLEYRIEFFDNDFYGFQPNSHAGDSLSAPTPLDKCILGINDVPKKAVSPKATVPSTGKKIEPGIIDDELGWKCFYVKVPSYAVVARSPEGGCYPQKVDNVPGTI